MRDVAIDTPSIRLDQLLKWADLTGSGGQSKIMIQSGLVLVNGEKELRRGRTLVNGDIVELEGMEAVRIVGCSGEM